jgi:hypothetical protein
MVQLVIRVEDVVPTAEKLRLAQRTKEHLEGSDFNDLQNAKDHLDRLIACLEADLTIEEITGGKE